MARTAPLRIGNAGGYWGDDPGALQRQVDKGPLDYITMDFLAEVTMSILQRQYMKDPSLGYARDFIPMLEPVLEKLLKNKTRIITNAGGINPKSCADAILKMAEKKGLNPKVAVVDGDDILSNIDSLQAEGVSFENMETGESFSKVKEHLSAANVYFGASPVVAALEKWQPDIIITGRVTDTGITLAPMIYEFGWKDNDWDKLASGIVAGHMLECGCQITGGNFSDWQLVKNFDEMGYPLVEVSPNGDFVLTKHERTGGLVSCDTVREQLFYEMGNPKAYISPDLVADFSSIKLSEQSENRVHVSGVKGCEPTPTYKISMAYYDGWKCLGSILLSGPNVRAKAEKFAEIFWKRCPKNVEETSTEYVGWNACHKSLGLKDDGNEIILRLGARSNEKEPLEKFAKLIPSLILSGPPGVAVLGGVPKLQRVVSYWPALIPKDKVWPKISLCGQETKEDTIKKLITGNFTSSEENIQKAVTASQGVKEAIESCHSTKGHTLYDICLARSGDKGDSVNIGILARGPESYKFIKSFLSAQKVKNLFQESCLGQVRRFELDGLRGLNFLLDQSLGGGGSCTLRSDAQGKTFSQALLRQSVELPESVLKEMSQYKK